MIFNWSNAFWLIRCVIWNVWYCTTLTIKNEYHYNIKLQYRSTTDFVIPVNILIHFILISEVVSNNNCLRLRLRLTESIATGHIESCGCMHRASDRARLKLTEPLKPQVTIIILRSKSGAVKRGADARTPQFENQSVKPVYGAFVMR